MKETGRSLFVGALALALSVSPVSQIGAQERSRGNENAAAEAALSAQRAATAESILAAKEEARGEAFDAAIRAGLKSRMETLSLEQLAGLALQGADADLPHALGSVTSDLVYTPVTPCRVFDTRPGSGGPGPIAAGGQYNVLVAGSAAGFVTQGGTAGGCGVPVGATSAIINFVTIAPSGPGNIRAWAVANPQPAPPNAAIINYGVVAGLAAIANGVAVPLCNPAATSCAAGDLRLQADTSSTNILGDVVGYFRNPQGLGTVPGATTASVGVYGFASIPINTSGTFTFAGPTPTIAVPAGGRLYGSAVLAIQSTSAIQWDVCYRLGAGTVTHMSGSAYPNGITSATQVPFAAAGIVTGLAAGNYTVGFCHRNNTAAASANYVNGYFVATNP